MTTGRRSRPELSFVRTMKPKHPGGRPPKPASERASADINIRTTKATKATLKGAAKAREVTLSAFVLGAAMEKAKGDKW